jgi:hypothetical protein
MLGLSLGMLAASHALAQDMKPTQPAIADAPPDWPPPCCQSPDPDPLPSACPNACDFFLVPPRMRCYVEAEGVAMHRDLAHGTDFAALNTPTTIVLSTRDLEHDYQPGGRLLIGYTCNECFQVEGVYLGVSAGSRFAAVRNSTPNIFGAEGNLFSPFGGFGISPIPGLDFNNLAEINLDYSLQSAELNIRRKLPMPPERMAASILFGVRYMTMPEQFSYTTTSVLPAPGVSNSIQINTENSMIGPQIGALFELYVDNRWWINFEMKGALMSDNARQSTSYRAVDNTGQAQVFTGERSQRGTAALADLAATLIYRWSPNVSTRLGYQALMLRDVATAAANFPTDIGVLTEGPAQLNHNSDVVIHGPQAGITIAW